MAVAPLWYTCCIVDQEGTRLKSWDLGVLPVGLTGATTSPLRFVVSSERSRSRPLPPASVSVSFWIPPSSQSRMSSLPLPPLGRRCRRTDGSCPGRCRRTPSRPTTRTADRCPGCLAACSRAWGSRRGGARRRPGRRFRKSSPVFVATLQHPPSPPSRMSSPCSPKRRSSSPCPDSVSSPLPPQITSSPSPPVIVSSPLSPTITSGPGVPVRRSSPFVPTIVAGMPVAGGYRLLRRGAAERQQRDRDHDRQRNQCTSHGGSSYGAPEGTAAHGRSEANWTNVQPGVPETPERFSSSRQAAIVAAISFESSGTPSRPQLDRGVLALARSSARGRRACLDRSGPLTST